MRVVLADDAAFFRETLATALASAGFEIVGQAGDVAGLFGLVRTSAPDVAIIDIRMPPTNTTEGLDAAARIRADHPGIGLLILSNTIETRHVLQLLRDAPEGIGYLLKDRVGDLAEFVERGATSGLRWLGRRPRGRLGHARTPTPARSARRAHAARARGPRAHGRGPIQPRHRVELVVGREDRRDQRRGHPLQARVEDAPDDHRRVLAVLSWLRRA